MTIQQYKFRFFLFSFPQLDGDNATPNAHQCRRHSTVHQLDRAEQRRSARDHCSFTVAHSMTTSSSHSRSHAERNERNIDESTKTAAKTVVVNNQRDEFHATNAHDASRSVIVRQQRQRPSTGISTDNADRPAATTFNTNANANAM